MVFNFTFWLVPLYFECHLPFEAHDKQTHILLVCSSGLSSVLLDAFLNRQIVLWKLDYQLRSLQSQMSRSELDTNVIQWSVISGRFYWCRSYFWGPAKAKGVDRRVGLMSSLELCSRHIQSVAHQLEGSLATVLVALSLWSAVGHRMYLLYLPGGRMGSNSYFNEHHLFPPPLFVSGAGNIIPLLYIIPLLSCFTLDCICEGVKTCIWK